MVNDDNESERAREFIVEKKTAASLELNHKGGLSFDPSLYGEIPKSLVSIDTIILSIICFS